MTVRRMNEATVSFRRDIIAALAAGGCSQGACHGTPAGKNGFALSLRGSDPAADFRALTRDQFGRRTVPGDASGSLMLQKGMGAVQHEGGVRWRAGSAPAQLCEAWIRAGCPDDSAQLPALARLEIIASSAMLAAPDLTRQLAVRAHWADGSVRDVTRLCVFTSSDPAIADVGETGRVTFSNSGEVAILARYLDSMQVVNLTCIERRPDFAWPNPPENNEIDRLLFAKFRQLQIVPAGLCSDAQFLHESRWISPERSRACRSAKRSSTIRRRINENARSTGCSKSPQFADFWALKWSDVLRTSRKSMQAKGAGSA